MTSCSWILLECVKLYVFILLTMYRIAACLCSGGWQDVLGMMVSVAVGFLYIEGEFVGFLVNGNI
jgi:hypothetical protein